MLCFFNSSKKSLVCGFGFRSIPGHVQQDSINPGSLVDGKELLTPCSITLSERHAAKCWWAGKLGKLGKLSKLRNLGKSINSITRWPLTKQALDNIISTHFHFFAFSALYYPFPLFFLLLSKDIFTTSFSASDECSSG